MSVVFDEAAAKALRACRDMRTGAIDVSKINSSSVFSEYLKGLFYNFKIGDLSAEALCTRLNQLLTEATGFDEYPGMLARVLDLSAEAEISFTGLPWGLERLSMIFAQAFFTDRDDADDIDDELDGSAEEPQALVLEPARYVAQLDLSGLIVSWLNEPENTEFGGVIRQLHERGFNHFSIPGISLLKLAYSQNFAMGMRLASLGIIDIAEHDPIFDFELSVVARETAPSARTAAVSHADLGAEAPPPAAPTNSPALLPVPPPYPLVRSSWRGGSEDWSEDADDLVVTGAGYQPVPQNPRSSIVVYNPVDAEGISDSPARSELDLEVRLVM